MLVFVLVDPGEPIPPDATARIPDELLELEPGVEPCTCPTCDGERFIETAGTAWHSATLEQWYPALDCSYRPCGRCHATGEILDYQPPPLILEVEGGVYAPRRAA